MIRSGLKVGSLVLLMVLMSTSVDAQVLLPAVKVVTAQDGSQEYSVTLQIVMLMTMLTFLPAIVIMMTSFIRISVVFAILRQALGMQQTPSNQILIGLTLFLTFFIMSPVINEVNDTAIQPYIQEQITSKQAMDIAVEPFKRFMLAQIRENDLVMFMEIAGVTSAKEQYNELPLTIIAPAFITSELKTAFQIGFLLFIPFLIVDLVISSILMAMGMMMLSPLIISLPFKIMLFVLVDGWVLVIGTLAGSFG
ncbi:flagellar type III secretion system pore protein FliP [Pleionea sp. CnH1-48]|uniref:flagellar type III secretion system pore protein FliP n=1 Tax=Pleionea sp. CnH1-48 TaxID=2954494 RepID=UPI0020975E17|nr:flagellar type III secretion system pore protein FliP [Pleionea sp. CnH1-48]MCO7226105.1 flagellar type III secretion system pore protein FliP [Pleionea sp. CnH1-48]